jgi:NitT/TauT family transport system substrate-binding protein
VQAFVNASIDGWNSYLTGDPAPANALIKKDNPEMTDAIIAQAITQMRDRGMVAGGDAATLGVGAMTDARWKTFFDMMKEAKVYDDKVDVAKAYTLAFVNKGHGVPAPPAKEQK